MKVNWIRISLFFISGIIALIDLVYNKHFYGMIIFFIFGGTYIHVLYERDKIIEKFAKQNKVVKR